MVHEWLARTRSDSPTIEHVGTDTMRLSLHIISRAGFGVRLLWPHEEEEKRSKGEETRLPPGHEMAYKDALEHLLENLVWVMLLPRWLLGEIHCRSLPLSMLIISTSASPFCKSETGVCSIRGMGSVYE